ncbi:MAG: FAD-dependent hydroxylase [Cyanobacteria bacterium Co-bin13]|nr:FAD-dependent hydroxylase [Cyanobacteria bacterium Co-bin13]
MASLPPQQTYPPLSAAALEAGPDQVLAVDVAIVGGGIIGLTLATALRSSGLTIAVIEAQTPEQAAARQRAYAFSLTSARIFQNLGLWPLVAPAITSFQRVKLSDGDYPQAVEFSPEDAGTDAVYYGAEHSVLMQALQQTVATASIHYLSSARVVRVETGAAATCLQIERGNCPLTLQAKLIVAADGAMSPLRQQAGISTFGWRYWQSCITVLLEPEQSHQDTAYERFWPSGPFAILPLSGNRCQIVWTAPHAEAQALLNLPQDQFMAELHRRYGSHMGQLKLLNQPRLFPVQLMQSRRYVQNRLALIGDAAHCCHPVGGQGLNMGIRDAAALAEVLIQAHQQGDDLGALTVLRRYERWRQRENWLILSFTDFLTRCFSNRFFPLVLLRRLGINVLHQVRPLRRVALRLMTGRFGRIPQIFGRH